MTRVKQAAAEVIRRLEKSAVKPIKPARSGYKLPEPKAAMPKIKPKSKKNFLDEFNQVKKDKGL